MENRPAGRGWSLLVIAAALVLIPSPTAIAEGVPGNAAEGDQAGESRPNILFVVSDDLRPELGCYGNDIIKSPNIDRLAERGLLFKRAYCQQAVCSPSRTSVMTGTRPDSSKVWDLTTHFREELPQVVTLPQLFKQHGYVTKRFGKIYHGSELDDPLSWSETEADRRADKVRGVLSKKAIVARRKKVANRKRGPAFRKSDDPPNGGGEGRLADQAIAALGELHASEQPFFLAVGFHKPHLPFVAPRAYWDMYDPEAIPQATNQFLPHDAPPYALVDRNEMWKYRGVPDVSHLPDAYARQLKHGYYAAVSYMDAQLGRILDEVDNLGLDENTIVVLWGDHGWKLGEHDRWCKHSNVEDDTRVPLIIRAPGMRQAGRSTEALVELVDIYPTLADLAGLPLPPHLEGASFTPLMEDAARPWKPAVYSQYPRTSRGKRLMGYSMRTSRYRFTRWTERSNPSRADAIELYDHDIDPQENTNVAKDPTNKELVDRLTIQWSAGWQGARPETQE